MVSVGEYHSDILTSSPQYCSTWLLELTTPSPCLASQVWAAPRIQCSAKGGGNTPIKILRLSCVRLPLTRWWKFHQARIAGLLERLLHFTMLLDSGWRLCSGGQLLTQQWSGVDDIHSVCIVSVCYTVHLQSFSMALEHWQWLGI